MRVSRGVWVGTVVLAAAAACSNGDNTNFPLLGVEGGAPHYDGGAEDATSAEDSGHGGGADATADAAGDEPTAEAGADGGVEAASAVEAGADAAPGEAGEEAGPEAGHDAGADAAGEAGHDAAPEAEAAAPEAGVEAGVDAAPEAAVEAGQDAAPEAEAGVDSAADAAQDAKPDAITVIPPVCDGVVGPNEYGGTGNQAAASSGQTWLMTWDETNLYVAIENANILEGDILYFGGPSVGLTSGRLYDQTDVTTLPFPAQLAVYAHDGYTEARPLNAGAWGAPDTTSVRQCTNGTAQVREEVIPWTLLGGRPASFSWTGYLAADGSQNPNGFIYGQMPTANPGGAPANNDTFTKYFFISDATPGVGMPFAVIQ